MNYERTVTPEQWDRINELFHAASKLAPNQRDAYLIEACPDEFIRLEVRSLLANATGDDFLKIGPRYLGKTLGAYEVTEYIGEGSMGQVYKAHDTKLDRWVALKFLPHELKKDARGRERLLREAKSASALNHPNIVVIHNVERDEALDVDFIVMEYIAGRTLARIIGAKAIPVDQTVRCAIQIADALAAAHARGILHGDLKPANIMINDQDLVKVLDFGLARLLNRELGGDPAKSEFFGTTAYMAPERVGSLLTDPRSEIFSFGVILYEMLAGEHPFKAGGRNREELAAAVINEVPVPLARSVPSWLVAVVTKCLEKDPADRYQRIDEVADDLKPVPAAISGVRGVVPRISVSWRTRISLAAVFVGIGTALLLAYLLPFFRRTHSEVVPDQSIGRALTTSTGEGRRPSRMILESPTDSLVVSADGKTLFATARAASPPGKLFVISLETHQVRSIDLPIDGGPLALSPSGILYIGSKNRGVLMLDTKHGRLEPKPILTEGPVWDMALTPDGGKLFLAMGSRGVKRLNLKTADLKQVTPQTCPEHLEIDGPGRRLYVAYQCGGPGGRAGHDALEIFDAESEKSLGIVTGLPMVGGAPASSPDGELVTLDGADACYAPTYDHLGCPFVPSRIFHILNGQDQKIIRTLAFPDSASGRVRFLDNRRLLVLGNALTVVDAANGTRPEEWNHQLGYFDRSVLTPDRSQLIIGSTDRRELLFLNIEKPTCEPAQDGLVNFYPGDGTLADTAGDTTLVPTGRVVFAPGRVGQAFYFDGVKSFLTGSSNNHFTFGPQDSTLMFYVKLASLSAPMTLWHRMTDDGAKGISLTISSDDRFVFQAVTSTGPVKLVSETRLVDNRWYHVAVTKSAHDLIFYVNGHPDARAELSNPLIVPIPSDIVTRLQLGGTGAAGEFLHGWLDEIAFYNRSLTSEEVSAIYQRRESGPCRL